MINPAVFFLVDILLSGIAAPSCNPAKWPCIPRMLDYSQLFQWISAFDLTFEIPFLCVAACPSFLWKIYSNIECVTPKNATENFLEIDK